MKKILISSVFIVIIFSCSKKESSSSIPDYSSVSSTDIPSEPIPKIDSVTISVKNIEEGKSLIEGADCLTCHKTTGKLIGPSYLDVAGKYESTPENIELLAGKIVDGGSGVWGDIPMAAHPGMSKENAKKMVEYILSLKK